MELLIFANKELMPDMRLSIYYNVLTVGPNVVEAHALNCKEQCTFLAYRLLQKEYI